MASLAKIAGQYTNLKLDNAGKALIGIDYPHHEIHAGNMHIACTLYGTVGDQADFLIRTAGKTAHLTYAVDTEAKSYIRLYEDTKLKTTIGTTITSYGLNRQASKTAVTLTYRNPVINTTGDVITVEMIGGGGNLKSHVGGGTRSGVEIVLKKNEDYILRVTNAITTSKDISACIEWYEEDI
jgi:hypothetical protein